MTALEVLLEKSDKLVESCTSSMVDGGAKDFAEYQNLCGYVKGLLTVRREILDLKSKLENSDE